MIGMQRLSNALARACYSRVNLLTSHTQALFKWVAGSNPQYHVSSAQRFRSSILRQTRGEVGSNHVVRRVPSSVTVLMLRPCHQVLDLEAAVRIVKDAAPEARVVADGVAFAPHLPVDVAAWGVDWCVATATKVCKAAHLYVHRLPLVIEVCSVSD